MTIVVLVHGHNAEQIVQHVMGPIISFLKFLVAVKLIIMCMYIASSPSSSNKGPGHKANVQGAAILAYYYHSWSRKEEDMHNRTLTCNIIIKIITENLCLFHADSN